ncbi:MAG: response regulator [Candidatus Methanomethyliaceae archaeon]
MLAPYELYFFDKWVEKHASNEGNVKAIFAKVTKSNIAIFEELLRWRFDPNTYRIPCWIWGDGVSLFDSVLWPKNSLDYISSQWDEASCVAWIEKNFKSSPKKLNFGISFEDRLEQISALEILITVGLNQSSGILSTVRSDGSNAGFKIEKGCLAKAFSRHITGIDALYDLISWREGVFVWDLNLSWDFPVECDRDIVDPLPILKILDDYHSLIRENLHIFRIIDSLKTMIELKESHCALDDPADPFFDHYKLICDALSRQIMSIDTLLKASTLSPARTLFFVNRIISLGDAVARAAEQADHAYLASIDTAPREDQSTAYKALVVDDAPFFLKVLTRILDRDDRFTVVATAQDGIECLEALKEHDPDVITLDLEMPRMDGLSALKRIMIQNPKPVVVLSAFTTESSRMTYDAFKFGAVDVIEKPKNFSLQEMEQNTRDILNRLARAAQVQLDEVRYIRKSGGESIKNDLVDAKAEKSVNTISHAAPKKLFINVFGAGSFSHFIKILFLLDSIDWDTTMVSVIPVKFGALRELISYIKMDCRKSIELVDENPSLMSSKCHYICAQDRFVSISKLDDTIVVGFKSSAVEELRVARTDVLLNLLSSAWSVFNSRLVISGISGNEEDVEVFEQCARRGIPIFYLRAEKCLYPGLSIKLRERGIGVEVEGLDCLVESWEKVENNI